ncbi:MAG: tRNA-intron lyase [Desulfurococcales archaeon ex4484_58]|nr:MAG: tRNA-intron lyase [Desulfurococcales archaeon ex4484_58]
MGFLLYNRVIIPSYECANNIYWNGYYGSFLGVQKPKEKNIQAPLELSLIESLYLLEKGEIKVKYRDREITWNELYERGLKVIEEFKELYLVYRDLRERGFVVRRGLKFGCDYLVYRFGPGIDHAPFGVEVLREEESYDPITIVRMGRLLHSVRKKLILAIVNGEKIKYILLTWWKP